MLAENQAVTGGAYVVLSTSKFCHAWRWPTITPITLSQRLTSQDQAKTRAIMSTFEPVVCRLTNSSTWLILQVVIDGKGHLLGRLASTVAKQLLNGQKIVVVRCEQLNISGEFFRAKRMFLEATPSNLIMSSQVPSFLAQADQIQPYKRRTMAFPHTSQDVLAYSPWYDSTQDRTRCSSDATP